MPDHLLAPEIASYLGLAWVLFLAALSAIYRTNKGKPVLFWSVPDADFVVHFASGHAGRKWFLGFGGASNCLVVAVAHGRFIVRPWFPFNLLFLPEIFGIECDVPLEWVTSASCSDSRFSIHRIVIDFHDELLQPHTISLLVRDPERLLEFLPGRKEHEP